MKFPFRFALLALLPLSLLRAEDPAAPDKAPERTKFPYEQAYSNLPKEKREEFSKLDAEAKRLYDQKRIFEAIDKIKDAEKIFPDYPDVKTLEGACYVEFRAFDKARACFDKANALAPDQPAILFNIAELEYVTKDWKNAQPALAKVLALVKDNKSQTQLARLVEFKILLCKLKLGDIAGAKAMAANHDFMDDSPYYYYAEAAVAYQEGREMDAEAALSRANRIFQGSNMVAPWQDTLIEFGYIKGFFGGDDAEEH